MTKSLLPNNASNVEKAFDLALAKQLYAIEIDNILDQWDPYKCDAKLLPWLAWALSVDNWNSDWPEQTRREVIAQSVEVHKRKGTTKSIKDILNAAGYTENTLNTSGTVDYHNGTHTRDGSIDHAGELLNWPAYSISINQAITTEQLSEVKKLIERTHPSRSNLEFIRYIGAQKLHNGEITRNGNHTYGAS